MSTRISRTTNKIKVPIEIISKKINSIDVIPNSAPLVIKTFKLNSITTNTTKPLMSNLFIDTSLAFVSGVPLIRNNAMSEITMEIMKIQRQPKSVATAPPKNEQTPEPPHEPIDQ